MLEYCKEVLDYKTSSIDEAAYKMMVMFGDPPTKAIENFDNFIKQHYSYANNSLSIFDKEIPILKDAEGKETFHLKDWQRYCVVSSPCNFVVPNVKRIPLILAGVQNSCAMGPIIEQVIPSGSSVFDAKIAKLPFQQPPSIRVLSKRNARKINFFASS